MTLTDSQGRVVARVPRVSASKSLFGFIRDRSDLGEFTLERPAIEVVCTNQTTNHEDVLRKYIDDETPKGPTRPGVGIRVTGGTLTLRDSDNGNSTELRDLEAAATIPATRAEPIGIKIAATATGELDADIALGESSRVKLTTNGFALESFAPLLRRFEPGLMLAGSLTADLTATWSKDAASVEGKLAVVNLAVSGPWLNGDTLRLASVELPLNVSKSGRAVRIEQAELVSELGRVSISGAFDPDEPIEKFLERPGGKLDANIQLAKLAVTLPKLLRVRAGTELREGNLVVKVESRATPEGTAWNGNVKTTALKAMRDGREIKWDEPLSVEFAGRFKPGQLPVFDKLVCLSEFIAIQAEVKPESIRAAANIYLDRLAVRLADFVDLGGDTRRPRRATPSCNARPMARLRERPLNGSSSPSLTATEGTEGTATGDSTHGSGKALDDGPISITTATRPWAQARTNFA